MVALCGLGLAAATAWLFHLQANAPALSDISSDLRQHLSFAREFSEGRRLIPHPGFHVVILALSHFFGMSLASASIVLLTSATLASYGVVVLILRAHLALDCSGSVRAALALGLTLASALYVPLVSRYIYLGQGTPNIWHNPTWIAAQPFALFAFYETDRWWCTRPQTGSPRIPLLASLALLLSAVFKPSFAVVFIPAVALLVCWDRIAHSHERIPLLGLAIIVAPTLLLLAQQYTMKYDFATWEQGRVIFAPFLVWSKKTSCIPGSVVLTLAFPLAVLLTLRRANVPPAYWLAWMVMGVGFLQRALLAESGERMMAGNWGWGYMFALKICFIYAVVALFHQGRWMRLGPARRWLPYGLFLAHVITGVVYFSRLLAGRSFY